MLHLFFQTSESTPRTIPRTPTTKSGNPEMSAIGGIVSSQFRDNCGNWKNRHGARLKIVRTPPRQVHTIPTPRPRICSSFDEVTRLFLTSVLCPFIGC